MSKKQLPNNMYGHIKMVLTCGSPHLNTEHYKQLAAILVLVSVDLRIVVHVWSSTLVLKAKRLWVHGHNPDRWHKYLEIKYLLLVYIDIPIIINKLYDVSKWIIQTVTLMISIKYYVIMTLEHIVATLIHAALLCPPAFIWSLCHFIVTWRTFMEWHMSHNCDNDGTTTTH